MKTRRPHKSKLMLKAIIGIIVLAVVFNLFNIGLGSLFGFIVDAFVGILLFVVLGAVDILLFVVLGAVDVLLFVVDIFVWLIVSIVNLFVFLLLSALTLAGYAVMAAVFIIPALLLYQYWQNNQKQNKAS